MFLAPLILANFAYLILFDFLPSGIRLAAAGMLGVGYLALALTGAAMRGGAGTAVMLAGVLLIVGAWAVGALLDPGDAMRQDAGITEGFQKATGYLAAIAILSYPDRVPRRAIVVAVGVTILFALVMGVTGGGARIGGEIRVSGFTGSPRADVEILAPAGWVRSGVGLHASGYTMVLCLILLLTAARQQIVSWRVAALLGAVGTALALAYGVRTSWVMLSVYAALLVWLAMVAYSRQAALLAFVALSLAVPLGAIAIGVSLSSVDAAALSDFSSGRLGNYAERLAVVQDRGLFTLLFGTGPGSDKMYTSSWWWMRSDSHNDFLNLVVEAGLVGLMGMALLLGGILRHAGGSSLPHIGAIIASSGTSNALMNRPLIVPLLYIAIAMAMRPAAGAAGEHMVGLGDGRSRDSALG